MIAQGEKVRVFEDRMAKYVGCAGGVATCSGTAALILALEALGVNPKSEVVLPTYTCPSVIDAVRAVGAVPVLCDVGPDWNMTPETARRCITPRARAVIVVSTFGIANPADPYRDLEIPIIEDCCQNLAPSDRLSGEAALGDVRVFSFHATKCLATGEGGMATSADPDLVQTMRRIRDESGGQQPVGRRVAAPMTDIQATLGLSQLARYAEFLVQRKNIAERYFHEFDTGCLELPHSIRRRSMFFRFPVRWPGEFATIQGRFRDKGIHVRRGVDVLLHRVLGLESDSFPVAEKLFTETVSIPIYPTLTDDEQRRIIAACKEIAPGR
jgi:UDP-4-amino-4-deoxy-L-arabinose-oxoglutarate aminotransferase